MAEYSYPFDESEVQEAQWTKFTKYFVANGVLANYENELEVYADSTGMQVKVKTGMGSIRGHFYETTAELTKAVEDADVSNDRIDIVALQVDWSNGDMEILVIEGTPAASPVAPSLTQNANLWQIPLAYVDVGTGVSTIAAGDVTDKRVRVGVSLWPGNLIIGNGTSAITAGYQGHLILPPKPLKIIGIYALGDQAGAIKIDLWLTDEGISDGVPTNTESICGTDEFEITASAVYGKKESFTGWTQKINSYEGVIRALGINVDSAATFTQLTLMILCEVYEVDE